MLFLQAYIILSSMNVTKQLWSMTSAPIGACWTESMKLGAEFHSHAQDEFLQDVQEKNARLAEQLGICLLRLQLAGESLKLLKVCLLFFWGFGSRGALILPGLAGQAGLAREGDGGGEGAYGVLRTAGARGGGAAPARSVDLGRATAARRHVGSPARPAVAR